MLEKKNLKKWLTMYNLVEIPATINLPISLKKLKDFALYALDHRFFRKYRYYSKILEGYHDIHKGERCFIVGTGPSLKKTNIKLLKNETVFGVNTLYKGLKDFGITCRYYAVSDLKVWEGHYRKILPLDTTLFISSFVGKEYINNQKKYRQYQKKEPLVLRTKGYITVCKNFSKDISKYVINGHSVVADICLQVAYYMGFKEVYLVGCDYSNIGYRWDGSKTENVKTVGLTNWEKIFYAFEICRKAFEKDGREIINATVGGELNVFKRKSLEEIIA